MQDEKKATRYNFKTLCRIQGLNVVLAEMDSDSHISLITQEYFENCIQPVLTPQNYLNEEPPTFRGFGAFLTSKYPPLKLDFQIGGVLLSGRFIITSELHSSPVLIGSDIIHKYGISLIALTNGKWRIQIGYEPQATVPCIVSYKLNLLENSHLETKKAILNTFEGDEDLEAIEPGIEITGTVLEKDKELDFVRTHPRIPESCKQQLIDCLEKIPDLYSGKEFSKRHVPKEMYEHDVEFLDEHKVELNARPYKASGIWLEQLKQCVDEMIEN